MKKTSLIAAVAMLAFSVSPSAYADTNGDVLAELQALKARVAELESKLATQAQATTVGGHSWHEGPPASVTLPGLVEGMTLSGFVNASANANFNAPDTLTNVGRVFDRTPSSFNLNATELVFQKAVSAESRAGFRADIYLGNDAEVIGSTGLGSTSDEIDIEQAYVEFLMPAGKVISGMNDVDLKLGKFVTPLGAEVIESKDNWNTSRGLLFGYAIPFTHTGAYASYTFNNGWDIAGGVVNGWDVVDDNNTAKTVLGHFGFNNIALPEDSSLTVSLNVVSGPEAAADDNSYRTVSDVVAIYKTPWKPLTLMYNFDYGHESDLLAASNAANWYGHAGYARIDINDQWSISGRGEYLNDTDGVRVVSGTPAEFWELTGTLEYRPWKNTITRLELRYDDADRNVYNDDVLGVLTDNQTTLSAEVIYFF